MNTIKIDNVEINIDKILEAAKEAGYTVTKNYQAWRPKSGERYEYLGGEGSLYISTWDEHKLDPMRLSCGNVYPVGSGQAQKALERQLATVRVLAEYRRREALDDKFVALGWGRDSQDKYHPMYDHNKGLLRAGTCLDLQDKPPERYSTQAIIEQVNGEMESDVKLMIGICDE